MKQRSLVAGGGRIQEPVEVWKVHPAVSSLVDRLLFWLMALLSGGGHRPLKWINTISITIDHTFVLGTIFCAVGFLHKPISSSVSQPIVSITFNCGVDYFNPDRVHNSTTHLPKNVICTPSAAQSQPHVSSLYICVSTLWGICAMYFWTHTHHTNKTPSFLLLPCFSNRGGGTDEGLK